MQGETLSLLNDACPTLDIQEISFFVFLLKYADDMTLFFESPDGLQHMLNALSDYFFE